MYLLDTNLCSRIIAAEPNALARLTSADGEQVAISIVVRGELIFMAENSQHRVSNLALIHAFLQSVQTLTIDTATADLYGQLKGEFYAYFGPKEKSKRRKTTVNQLGISDNDLWIAAIALQHDLILVSSDSDFLRLGQVRPLKLESW